jgi:hypothetical protein
MFGYKFSANDGTLLNGAIVMRSIDRNARWLAACWLVLTAGGCITPSYEWKKDGVKSDQVKYDKAVCEYNAEIQAGPVGSLTGEQRAARKDQVKKMSGLCMTARGYKLEQVAIEP